MKLDALNRQGAVAKPHDDRPALRARSICLGRACSNFQLRRQRFLSHDQGVITGAGKRRRQSRENALAIMLHFARLAMHQALRAHHFAAKGFADGLMSQAYTEDRGLARHVTDQRNQDPRFARRTGPRRQQDALRLQRFNLFDGELVVAADQHVRPKLAQVLNQVVGEGIVVIEDKNHR